VYNLIEVISNEPNKNCDQSLVVSKIKQKNEYKKTYFNKTNRKQNKITRVNSQLIIKLINKKNKLYKKKKKRNIKHSKAFQEVKTQLQKKMRNGYWKYIEDRIFDIENTRTRSTKIQQTTPALHHSEVKVVYLQTPLIKGTF
jgi:hypothetical protein